MPHTCSGMTGDTTLPVDTDPVDTMTSPCATDALSVEDVCAIWHRVIDAAETGDVPEMSRLAQVLLDDGCGHCGHYAYRLAWYCQNDRTSLLSIRTLVSKAGPFAVNPDERAACAPLWKRVRRLDQE